MDEVPFSLDGDAGSDASTGSASGRAGVNPDHSPRASEIPLEVLREFVQELRDFHTDRGVAALTGLSTASVQDFARGRTTPERRTIRLFSDLYLTYQNAKALREAVPPLTSILPGGPEGALRVIGILLQAARETRRIEPEVLDGLGSWLRRIVLGEYGEPPPARSMDPPGRRRQNRGTAGTSEA
jgi:hypothetical protein